MAGGCWALVLRTFAAACLAGNVLASVTMPQIFSDGMVLQDHATYDQRPFVYGQADVGEVVNVNRTLPGQAPEVCRLRCKSGLSCSCFIQISLAALLRDCRRHRLLDC